MGKDAGYKFYSYYIMNYFCDIFCLTLKKLNILFNSIAGLWRFRCSKGCWKLPYFSAWTKYICCTNGKIFFFLSLILPLVFKNMHIVIL